LQQSDQDTAWKLVPIGKKSRIEQTHQKRMTVVIGKQSKGPGSHDRPGKGVDEHFPRHQDLVPAGEAKTPKQPVQLVCGGLDRRYLGTLNKSYRVRRKDRIQI